MEIPVGPVFESFVRWLKEAFGPFFDGLSRVLDFAITTLENVLLLDHALIYPSVVFALVVAVFIYFGYGGKLGKRTAGIIAIAFLVLFGALEIWRYNSLQTQFTPEEGRQFASELRGFEESLLTTAPGDYTAVVEALEAAQSSLEGTEGEPAEAAQREVFRALRNVDRVRPGQYDDVADELEDVVAALRGVDANTGIVDRLAAQERVYRTLSLARESDRLADRVVDLDEPMPRSTVLNQRTWDRYMELLALADDELPAMGADDSVISQRTTIQESLQRLNPAALAWFPWLVVIIFFALLALRFTSPGLAAFTFLGFLLIVSMGFWVSTMETLALVLSATLFALLIGVPVGVLAAQSDKVENAVKPVLDFMQTMPAFVYLIPAVLFFGLGKVPGAMATLIFAMPPAVRLTNLGIRQVPTEVVEAAEAFGCTTRQMLFKAQLPIAMPTILAGLNQTIMLALSMVVIGGMIGAGGLGEDVLSGITQLKIGLGFESGISVVILAIFLDRLTQAFGKR